MFDPNSLRFNIKGDNAARRHQFGRLLHRDTSNILRRKETSKNEHTVTMHNWSLLLLLAFVAVIQPIASFTERNLVDGRQQCCDRQTQSSLEDTRLSLDGTNNFRTVPENRRLNQRDEIREGRRYDERNYYGSELIRMSRERQRESREKQIPSETPDRFSRVDYRFDRVTADGQRRERFLSVARERTFRDTRTPERANREHRVSRSHSTREFISKNGRESFESVRNRLSGDESRRFGNAGTRISTDSRREETRRTQSSPAELRRISVSRDSRDILKRQLYDVTREISDNRYNRRIIRETTNVDRRANAAVDTSEQPDNTRERRSLDRRVRELVKENRRSLSSVNRVNVQVPMVRNERVINSRKIPQEHRHRIAKERIVTKRFDERREGRDENRAQIRDRTLVNRRETHQREFFEQRQFREAASRARTLEISTFQRSDTVRRETSYERDAKMRNRDQSRITSETRRVESRRMEKHNEDNRKSRLDERLDSRNVRHETQHRTADAIFARDNSRVRYEAANNRDKTAERVTSNTRFQNFGSVKNRIFSQKQVEPENQNFKNWQFIFYTLQGIYLCGLLVQMVKENGSEKVKSKGRRWWAAPTESLIKLD